LSFSLALAKGDVGLPFLPLELVGVGLAFHGMDCQRSNEAMGSSLKG